MSKMTIGERKIKETLLSDTKTPLYINLSCPTFDGENQACANKLNSYYSSGIDKFYEFLKNNAHRIVTKEKNTKPPGISMKSTVSFISEKHISIITDIEKFDGVKKTVLRLFDTKALPYCTPVRAKDIFCNDRNTKQKILSVITTSIIERDGGFEYFKDAVRKAEKRFKFDNFFLTLKGVCFYYDKKLLTENPNVYPCFVIPFDTLGIDFSAL